MQCRWTWAALQVLQPGWGSGGAGQRPGDGGALRPLLGMSWDCFHLQINSNRLFVLRRKHVLLSESSAVS